MKSIAPEPSKGFIPKRPHILGISTLKLRADKVLKVTITEMISGIPSKAI